MNKAVNNKTVNNDMTHDTSHWVHTRLGVKRHAQRLRWLWAAWLALRLLCLPWVMVLVVDVPVMQAWLWQLLVMLPVLIATPFVWRANNSYALIVVSFVLMVYWAVAASFWLIYAYERASLWVVVVYAIETGLLAWLFGCLFLLLKKPSRKARPNKAHHDNA